MKEYEDRPKKFGHLKAYISEVKTSTNFFLVFKQLLDKQKKIFLSKIFTDKSCKQKICH